MTERKLALDEDHALSVYDVMRILGVSRTYAYQVMAEAGAERFAKKCVRVRRSALDTWRKEHQQKCVSTSTSAVTSGGVEDLTEASSSDGQPSRRARQRRGKSETAGSASSLIRPITVRTKPRSPAPASGG